RPRVDAPTAPPGARPAGAAAGASRRLWVAAASSRPPDGDALPAAVLEAVGDVVGVQAISGAVDRHSAPRADGAAVGLDVRPAALAFHRAAAAVRAVIVPGSVSGGRG